MKKSLLLFFAITNFSFSCLAQSVGIGTTTITRGKLTILDSTSAYSYTTFLGTGLPMGPFVRSSIGFGGTNYTTGAISTIGIDAATARMAFYTGYTTGNILSASERITIANTGFVGINNSNPQTNLDLIGNMKISSNNSIEFGAGVAPKEINAGKIGYGTITAGELDIVGGGTTSSNRKIKLWSEAGTDFSGGIYIESGKLTHSNTGAANLLPYAYGTIGADGSILNGSGNFSVTKFGSGSYGVYLAGGESYSTALHTAVATPNGNSTAVFMQCYEGGGTQHPLIVSIVNYNAINAVDRAFSFIIYKP